MASGQEETICLLVLWRPVPLKDLSNNLWRIAAAAAKSLQLYPTLRDPIGGSPPVSSIPGILQARILEWAAIFFSIFGGPSTLNVWCHVRS